MITKFHIFEDNSENYWANKYRIRTKGLDMEEDDFILFKLKKNMNFNGWDYRTDELYIGHLYNIRIRPELHFKVTTENPYILLNSSYPNPEVDYEKMHTNGLTNMQFKLMLRQMNILEKGTLEDIVEKLRELKEYDKYNL